MHEYDVNILWAAFLPFSTNVGIKPIIVNPTKPSELKHPYLSEPCHEKTNILIMRKQRRRSASG